MIASIAKKIIGLSEQSLSVQQSRSILILFLIMAFSFNILPPSFTFNGISTLGSDGNIFNQLFWIVILLFSIPIFVNKSNIVIGTYVNATPLLVFCLLLLVSSLWSLAPAITLRRSILEVIVIVCILANVASLQKAEQVFIIIYRVAVITLFFELIMLFRSNGFDEEGFFRGIHTQKNVLGLIAAISIIVGVWIGRYKHLKLVHWNTLYLLLWAILLMISRSKTSLALTIVAPLLALGLMKTRRVGLSLLIVFGLLYTAFAITFISGVDVAREIERGIHSAGFTGRDDIWQFLIARFLERPWLGYGYGGFWDIGANAPNVRYGTGFIPMINQAHNGYLDLLLALGWVGLITYIMVLIGFVFCLSSALRNSELNLVLVSWSLIVFSMLHNFTESSLFRGYALAWLVQLIAMTVVYRLAHESRGAK
jgi:exopolysaccharide production protein ExoQ